MMEINKSNLLVLLFLDFIAIIIGKIAYCLKAYYKSKHAN